MEMDLVGVKLDVRFKIVLHVLRLKILCFWSNSKVFHRNFYAIIGIPLDLGLCDV